MGEKLTTKQKKFAEEFILDFNATRAAIAAGYSQKTARITAAENLTKPNIAEYIKELQKGIKEKYKITEEKIISELCAIAFAKVSDYVKIVPDIDYETMKQKATIKYVETSELSDMQKSAISEIRKTRDGISIKLGDKTKALELLGKHIGMFKDKISVNGKLETEMSDADRRLLEKVEKRLDAK